MLGSNERVVPLDGGINFRDIGGYRSRDGRYVKWQKLLRCGHLGNLSDSDVSRLESVGVSQIHDFRRREEQERSPNRSMRAQVFDDYQISIGSMSRFWDILLEGRLTAASSQSLVMNSYRDCIDEVSPAYSRFLREILNNSEGTSIFHCAAGKDRTGMAAGLILSALDVPRETIVEDYLLTLQHFDSEHLLTLVEQHLRDAKVEYWERDWLMPYCAVHRDNIEAFFDSIDQRYGDVKTYLEKALKFDRHDQEQMREMFLEGASCE